MLIEFYQLSLLSADHQRLIVLLNTLDQHYIPPISLSVNISEYATKILTSGYVTIVIKDEKDIGLIAMYRNIDNHVAFITSFGILPQYHASGITSKMMREVERVCIKTKMSKIRLEVTPANLKAISFYTRNGFEKESEAIDEQQPIYMVRQIINN